jgi:hypothetical protein
MNRLRVLLGVSVLALLAFPAAAADYPGCKECVSQCFSDSSCTTICDDKRTEGWGWEYCEFRQFQRAQICRGAGVTCYYLEVNG